METTTTPAPTQQSIPPGSYPDSVESSPRSRAGDSWDESFPSTSKLRLMCSYGGQIVPRPHDKSLCYLGGDTRIVVVDRHTTLDQLSAKLSRTLLHNRSFSLKYQLPSEDLDSLISVTTDEDLDNMVEEYDRLASSISSSSSGKNSRLRLFLFPAKTESPGSSSMGSLLDDSKSETWFVDALNGAIDMGRGLVEGSPASSVNCLLGLEEEQSVAVGGGRVEGGKKQEVQSVPDSPMMENSSSFGSTSSAPLLSNLPPIRVRPEEWSPDKRGYNGGLEEHFGHMTLGSGQKQEQNHNQNQNQSALGAGNSGVAVSGVPGASPRENPGWTLSDDEKLDQGGLRGLPIPVAHVAVHQQQKPSGAYDPLVSDRPSYYQERTTAVPVVGGWNMVGDQKQEGQNQVLDPNYRPVQVQVQVPEQNYVLPVQADQLQQLQQSQQHQQQQHQQQQHQQQQHQQQHHQQQLHQQQQHQQPPQQQQHQQPPQQQQQQFIQANPQLVQHHPSNQTPHLVQHHPSTPMVPIQSYYQVHPQLHPQQQLPPGHAYNSQIPMYFVPVQQNPAYSVSMQQPGVPEGGPAQISTSGKPSIPVLSQVMPSRGNPPPQKPELAPAGASIYRTAATPAAAVPQQSQAPQFMGYHPMHHHPSQAATAPYGYEFANQMATPQMYYTQAGSAPLPPQYQTISSSAPMVSDAQPQLHQPDLKQNRASS